MNFGEESIGIEEGASSPLEYILSENERSRNPFRYPVQPSSPRPHSRGSYRTQSSSSPEVILHRASKPIKDGRVTGQDGRLAGQFGQPPGQDGRVKMARKARIPKSDVWAEMSEDGSTDSSKPESREATDHESEGFTMMESEQKSKLSYSGIDGAKIVSKEVTDGIDGLVLMNSTRLRPAAKTSEKDEHYVQLYMHTFKSLFLRHDSVTAVISLAMHGNLKKNPFRSICWRMLLNVLPSSSMDWVATLQSLRSNFSQLQEKYLKDDRINDRSLDLVINNPLSQADDSPWNQHFQDSELRRVIEQDVNRTSPEIDFFQSDELRTSLSNILFVYAKAHPDLAYKQGMHELLAPLYYVVHSDLQAFKNSSSLSKERADVHQEFSRVIHEDIFDPKFLEADTYTLFEALMDCVSDWYRTGHQTRSAVNKNVSGSQPWSRPRNEPNGSIIVERLSHIQDSLLKRHDRDLYCRLEKLEIYPQLYGIRWLRLLFGREFHFVDTLTLWDAVFADSCPPGLVDQITVALLMSVRDLLLVYDYTDCVSLLMKLPSNINVSYVVAFALHLKDPLRYPRPSGTAFDCGSRRTISESGVIPPLSRASSTKSLGLTPKKSGSRRKKMSDKSGIKRELKEINKTYTFQNPRDLPDFTVVGLNDMKGRGDVDDACDNDEQRASGPRRQSQDQGNPVVTNSVYGSKIQMLKKLDSLRDLLRNENLVRQSKITSTLDELQELCNNLETTELFPDTAIEESKVTTTIPAPGTMMRHPSVASDVAMMIQ